ncbi:unnamed protein product [Prorocentrum cordatum]|uniref:Mei2-like C-terminal RNA recognition motif domain-containing protein n=1 Tax=Prorocentrum cordatum TaxID=2364126 RepID=A0ABN9SH22_9DINO|nr:unnamed protein product [Polarella glacialis]
MVDVVKAPRGAWSMPMKVDLGDARRKEMPMKVGIGDLDPTPSSSFSTNAPAENDLEPFEDSSQVDISFMEEDEEEAEEAAYYPGLWGTQERWDESQVFWPPCHEEAWCASGPWGAHGPQDAWYPHGQLVHGHFVAAAAQLLASGMHPGCWAPRPRGAARARPARAQAAAAEPKAEPKAASRAAKERGRAAAERESVVMPGEATTIMMRNLPNKYTRDSLLELLAEEGFAGLYDLARWRILARGLQHAGGPGLCLCQPRQPCACEALRGTFRWVLWLDRCRWEPEGLQGVVERRRAGSRGTRGAIQEQPGDALVRA